jgi:hypothetical protein
MAGNLGISENTVRKALLWSELSTPFGHAGRPKSLTLEHYNYIAERTIADRNREERFRTSE